MKKVSTNEKIFIISLFSIVGGAGAAISASTVIEAGAVGLVFGVLAAATIGTLHRIRS